MIAAGLVMADWDESLASYRVGVTGRSEFVNGLSFVVPLSFGPVFFFQIPTCSFHRRTP